MVSGCNQIGEGVFSGYATMKSPNKVFSLGSNVVADVCTKCGHIVSLRVTEPEKFK
jgi:hypothetical protein